MSHKLSPATDHESWNEWEMWCACVVREYEYVALLAVSSEMNLVWTNAAAGISFFPSALRTRVMGMHAVLIYSTSSFMPNTRYHACMKHELEHEWEKNNFRFVWIMKENEKTNISKAFAWGKYGGSNLAFCRIITEKHMRGKWHSNRMKWHRRTWKFT